MPKNLPLTPLSLFVTIFSLILISCDHSSTPSNEVIAGASLDEGIEAGNSTGGQNVMSGDEGGMSGGDTISGCQWHSDCEDAQCIDGECQPLGEACQFSNLCPLGEVCHEGYCVVPCITDRDCPEEGHCLRGVCQPYPDELFSPQPLELMGTPEQVYVGVGMAPLVFPVGVSPAGFGGRAGRRTPYNQSLGGSESVIERQDVRVIVIDQGEELLVLVRLPLAWSTDFLRTLIARKVSELTRDDTHPQGINVLDKLVIFATHSHSHPGRFWNLVPELPFGVLGFGTYSHSITLGYAQSTAEAVVQAINDRSPARLGWSLIDEADPEKRIHSNRRPTNDVLDDRLLAIRFDDLDGSPRAALIGFGIHGTHLMTPQLTGDAPAGIERTITNRLSQRYGYPVPALFANGNAGNISPRGDHLTQNSLGHIQTLGELLADVYLPQFEDIETDAQLTLKHRTTRVEMRYESFGYGDVYGDFAGGDGPFQLGGLQCVIAERGPEEMPHTLEEPGCLMDIQLIVHEPVAQLHKTVVSAIQLDQLLLTTLPGEPTSSLGLNLATSVEDEAVSRGLEGARSFNFGYAQDHQFYLLEPDDWFRGGYEASLNAWGPYLGRYLAEASLEAAIALLDDLPTPTSPLKPTWWPNVVDDLRSTPLEAPAEVSLIDTPPSIVKRGDLVSMSWSGGDPAVDLPRLSLIHADTGNMVTHPISGLPFDDRGFESILTYLGNYEEDQRWQSDWDLPFELMPGSYQFKVEGHYGPVDQPIPYTLTTEPFDLSGEEGLVIHEYFFEGQQLSLKATQANAPSNDLGTNTFSELKARGSYLHLARHLDLMTPTPSPLKKYRYLLGAPISGTIALEVYPSEPFADLEPIFTENLLVEPNLCRVELTTSRDEEGLETRQALDNVPCGLIEVDLTSLEGSGQFWVKIIDEWNSSAILAIDRE